MTTATIIQQNIDKLVQAIRTEGNIKKLSSSLEEYTGLLIGLQECVVLDTTGTTTTNDILSKLPSLFPALFIMLEAFLYNTVQVNKQDPLSTYSNLSSLLHYHQSVHGSSPTTRTSSSSSSSTKDNHPPPLHKGKASKHDIVITSIPTGRLDPTFGAALIIFCGTLAHHPFLVDLLRQPQYCMYSKYLLHLLIYHGVCSTLYYRLPINDAVLSTLIAMLGSFDIFPLHHSPPQQPSGTKNAGHGSDSSLPVLMDYFTAIEQSLCPILRPNNHTNPNGFDPPHLPFYPYSLCKEELPESRAIIIQQSLWLLDRIVRKSRNHLLREAVYQRLSKQEYTVPNYTHYLHSQGLFPSSTDVSSIVLPDLSIPLSSSQNWIIFVLQCLLHPFTDIGRQTLFSLQPFSVRGEHIMDVILPVCIFPPTFCPLPLSSSSTLQPVETVMKSVQKEIVQLILPGSYCFEMLLRYLCSCDYQDMMMGVCIWGILIRLCGTSISTYVHFPETGNHYHRRHSENITIDGAKSAWHNLLLDCSKQLPIYPTAFSQDSTNKADEIRLTLAAKLGEAYYDYRQRSSSNSAPNTNNVSLLDGLHYLFEATVRTSGKAYVRCGTFLAYRYLIDTIMDIQHKSIVMDSTVTVSGNDNDDPACKFRWITDLVQSCNDALIDRMDPDPRVRLAALGTWSYCYRRLFTALASTLSLQRISTETVVITSPNETLVEFLGHGTETLVKRYVDGLVKGLKDEEKIWYRKRKRDEMNGNGKDEAEELHELQNHSLSASILLSNSRITEEIQGFFKILGSLFIPDNQQSSPDLVRLPSVLVHTQGMCSSNAMDSKSFASYLETYAIHRTEPINYRRDPLPLFTDQITMLHPAIVRTLFHILEYYLSVLSTDDNKGIVSDSLSTLGIELWRSIVRSVTRILDTALIDPNHRTNTTRSSNATNSSINARRMHASAGSTILTTVFTWLKTTCSMYNLSSSLPAAGTSTPVHSLLASFLNDMQRVTRILIDNSSHSNHTGVLDGLRKVSNDILQDTIFSTDTNVSSLTGRWFSESTTEGKSTTATTTIEPRPVAVTTTTFESSQNVFDLPTQLDPSSVSIMNVTVSKRNHGTTIENDNTTTTGTTVSNGTTKNTSKNVQKIPVTGGDLTEEGGENSMMKENGNEPPVPKSKKAKRGAIVDSQ